MIKDQLFRRLFIPFAGILFPFLSGLVSLSTTAFLQLLLAVFFFTGVVYGCWTGVVKLTSMLRNLLLLQRHTFLKLMMLSLLSALYSGMLCLLAAVVWVNLVAPAVTSTPLLQSGIVGAVGGALLALMYEVVFLSVEKELDSRVLKQIDRERLEAEVNVLKNELDPHFFFNCMNTLSHLVREDGNKAYHFVHKLSNIYKYFLRHKEVDYVSLREELDFLDDYHYLLRIRFDDNIKIENSIEPQNGAVCILPCTLQVLVENAMKHNFFSEKEPLVISIAMNGYFITVSNPVRPKSQVADSTKVGLRNLKARYRLITNQNVLVQKTAGRFLVRLPIVKKTNVYDKSSDH